MVISVDVTSLGATTTTHRWDCSRAHANCRMDGDANRAAASGDADEVSTPDADARTDGVRDEEAGDQHVPTSTRASERLAETIESQELAAEVTTNGVADPAASSQQYDGDGGDTVDALALPKWIRVNFPHVASGEELKQQLQPSTPVAQTDVNSRLCYDSDVHSENQLTASSFEPTPSASTKLCEECGSRRVVFRCAECDQRLCFQCADAIHIVRSCSMCRF